MDKMKEQRTFNNKMKEQRTFNNKKYNLEHVYTDKKDASQFISGRRSLR